MAHYLDTTIEDLRKYDTRPSVEDIKRLASSYPLYGIAFRKVIDKQISARKLINLIEKETSEVRAMRTYRANDRHFEERQFYTNKDIEILCTDELNKVVFARLPSRPIPIDRFIEKRFRISPSYDELPEDVLGLIEFNEHGVRKISISKSLDEEGSKSSARRVNTTLAHETGHALLHTHLFVLREKPSSLLRGREYERIKDPLQGG